MRDRHLTVFDAVIATGGKHNLKGPAKRAAIQAYVEGGAFDYAGDAIADLPIFRASRRAILVHPGERLVRLARESCPVERMFSRVVSTRTSRPSAGSR